ALIAGHIVDISRPHRVYMLCTGALATISLSLLVVAGGLVSVAENQVLVFLFVMIFFSGLARSFIMPSSFVLLPRIVERAKIPGASAWLTSGFQIAAISGPAIAGLVYGGYGARAAWFLPVSLMTIAVVTLATISAPHRRFKSEQLRESAVKSI